MCNNKSSNENFPGTSNETAPNQLRVMIESFYIEGTEDVRPELFAEKAEKIAADFIGTNEEGQYGKVTQTQIRRLYDEVKRFEQILDGSQEKWNDNYPKIKKIPSLASYNITRAKQAQQYENIKVYDNLYEFIREGIGLIYNEKDYHVFKALFEAVYGFYYVKNPKKD